MVMMSSNLVAANIDAVLYCDVADVSSLVDHLAALIQDSALRGRLKKAGRKLSSEVAMIDSGERLLPVLERYAYVRRRWS